MNVFRILLASALFSSLLACSSMESISEGRGIDYKKSRTAPALEVPPDLTTTTIDDTMVVPDIDVNATASYSDYSSERTGTEARRSENVLPTAEKIEIARDGDKRWLVVQGNVEEMWDKVREFWLQMGFLMKMEDPRLGILETDWAENRSDIPEGPIRSFLKGALDALYSANTRDKYRTRIERGLKAGTTEIYITHRGAEEVLTGNQQGGGPASEWKPRASDPELEAEMLNRLVSFMGIEEKRARSMVAEARPSVLRAKLVRNSAGAVQLIISDEFARAWRRTGIALDRIGFTVEDRNRSNGVYYVRYIDPDKDAGSEDSWLSSLAFWSDDDEKAKHGSEFQISLRENGSETNVSILDKGGKQDDSATAQRILSLLHEQLK